MEERLKHFYLDREEPIKSCILAVRDIILDHHKAITEGVKYNLPFFLYKGKNLAYIWFDKNSGEPYIGIAKGSKINHPLLFSGDRNTIKIIQLKAEEDIPLKNIREILDLAMEHY